ncbi:hypothetical protein [Salipiger thiooxidans]|nr:hypothetical protein [Salipiger thiooxidans]
MILTNIKTGAWIPIQTEAAAHRAARSMGWTDYEIAPRHPHTSIGE